MEKYILEQNLKLFRKVLTETTNDEKRAQLIDLIHAEEAKRHSKAEFGSNSVGIAAQ